MPPLETKEPMVDAFGEPLKNKNEEKEGEKEGENKKEEDNKEKFIPEQQISDLSKKIGEYEQKEKSWNETNKSKDENIRAMKESIKRLEEQVKNKGGTGKENEDGQKTILFKEIKTSKDLTEDQKEEMTDTEIKQMDEIAGLKTALNQLADMMSKTNKEKEDGQLDANNIVRNTAKELAKGNKELTNQIIESVKDFNLQGLSEEEIEARVNKAALFVPNYKKPKEQATGQGGKPAGGLNDSDPYGVDKIVEEVHKKRENKSFDL